jgi:hypothetical protein
VKLGCLIHKVSGHGGQAQDIAALCHGSDKVIFHGQIVYQKCPYPASSRGDCQEADKICRAKPTSMIREKKLTMEMR